MGVAQKTTFSIDSSANSKRGVSGALIEYFRSGIGFITILPIFGLKTTSFPWPISPSFSHYSLYSKLQSNISHLLFPCRYYHYTLYIIILGGYSYHKSHSNPDIHISADKSSAKSITKSSRIRKTVSERNSTEHTDLRVSPIEVSYSTRRIVWLL